MINTQGLPFNYDLFITQYPEFSIYSQEILTNNYYNQALVLGNPVLSLFNQVLPNATWNAATNTPTLSNSTGQNGQSYLCIVAGDVDFGAGDVSFNVYDIVQFNQSPFGWWTNKGQPEYYYWSCIVLAHIMTLITSKQVGRVSNASQQPISGTFEYADTKNSTWWNQTTYGAMCWQRLKQRGGATYYAQAGYNGYSISNNNYYVY